MVKSVLWSVLRVFLVVFILFEVIGITCIDWFMFHPEVCRYRYGATEPGYVDIGGKDGRVAAIAYGSKGAKKAILRCHGNAENAVESLRVLKALTDRGYVVACVDYPGYGLSDGKPSEQGCYQAARRLYDWLVDTRGFAPEDIIVSGFSIGTGPAAQLASSVETGGLILEAPFLSAPRAVTGKRILPVDPFPNVDRIRWGIDAPLLILHGTEDPVVPFAQGEELAQLAKASCRYSGHARVFVPVEGAEHGDIASVYGITEYLDLVDDFANRRGRFAVRPRADEPDYVVATYGRPGTFFAWLLSGVVFAVALVTVLLVAGTLRRRRAERLKAEEIAASIPDLDGKVVKRAESRDPVKAPHVDAHTMSLGLGKMVKTGTSMDKGVMG